MKGKKELAEKGQRSRKTPALFSKLIRWWRQKKEDNNSDTDPEGTTQWRRVEHADFEFGGNSNQYIRCPDCSQKNCVFTFVRNGPCEYCGKLLKMKVAVQ